jgi:hypothetical protein
VHGLRAHVGHVPVESTTNTETIMSSKTTDRPLSAHAGALAEELDGGHVAAVAICTPEFAASEGMSFRQYDEWRRGELLSVGAAVQELRDAGWVLEVKRMVAPSPNCAEMIVVEAKHVGRAA